MPVGERIALARQAQNVAAKRLTAQGLAPLPRILSALDIPRPTWYYYQRQKVEADRRRQEADEKAVALMREVLGEHPQYGYRRLARELRRRGVVINEKRIRRLLNDFHLALRRGLKKPKPNPLLEIVLLAGERADLRAFLLREREPEPFELLYTDFTLLPYRGGRVWFMPILGQPQAILPTPRGWFWPGGCFLLPRRRQPWGCGRRPRPTSASRGEEYPGPLSTTTRGEPF